MKLFTDCWVALLDVFNALTGTLTDGTQQSLGLGHHRPGHGHVPHYPFPPKKPSPPTPTPSKIPVPVLPPPIFSPPSLGESPDSSILCDYTAMGPGWGACSSPEDRGCWLKGPNGQKFSIDTDYETKYPKGVTRKYFLDVANMTIDADGVPNKWGKVFNQSYPGPWLQACWGDDVEITVKNSLLYNGTTVHWHGIRMLNSFEHDGVNAVTQCPIATGDYFTYKFKAIQYGTSWYHSHYSLQYGDGMLGPLTIHGPATANFDRPVDPILMTDWNHRSAFMDFQKELDGTGPPKMDSILLNGIGSYASVGKGGLKYTLTFKYGRRYLLRLINTSVDTTFVFAIDNHWLKVITSDFVPIHPYVVDHVVVGIGQRYHVIVEGRPHDKNNNIIPDREDNAYWIRTIPATNCSNFLLGGVPDERQGILNYRNDSTAIPTTERGNFSIACRDEPYEKLVPYLPWNVSFIGGDDDVIQRKPFEIGLEVPEFPNGKPQPNDLFYRWSMGKDPMWLNFSDPTVLNLDKKTFPSEKVVIPKDYAEGAWVYLVITSFPPEVLEDKDRVFVAAAHPMHLHGHDFALLQQSSEPYTNARFNPKFDNPPRRDVVLLPINGFIVIGFKADNPGAWALHCHIAWHASSGLAIQVLERQEDAVKLLTDEPQRLDEIHRTCKNWRKWFSNPENFWHPEGGAQAFQDDSGV